MDRWTGGRCGSVPPAPPNGAQLIVGSQWQAWKGWCVACTLFRPSGTLFRPSGTGVEPACTTTPMSHHTERREASALPGLDNAALRPAATPTPPQALERRRPTPHPALVQLSAYTTLHPTLHITTPSCPALCPHAGKLRSGAWRCRRGVPLQLTGQGCSPRERGRRQRHPPLPARRPLLPQPTVPRLPLLQQSNDLDL